jgi:hypothetical protein
MAYSPEGERLEFALAEKHQQLLDSHMRSASAGSAIMRNRSEGSWQPLSPQAKTLIKREMMLRFPPEGALTPLQAEINRNPGYAEVLKASLAQSTSQYTRTGPNIKGEGKKVLTLDPPGVVFVPEQRRPRGQQMVEFDCKTGRPCSMSYPQGISEWMKPIPLALTAKDWDPATADVMLDLVRWKVGAPVKLLQPGEAEPE